MFSHFLANEQDRIESLAGIAQPGKEAAKIFLTSGKGLVAEDAAALFSAARDQNRRSKIQDAAIQVRERSAQKAVEFIIPVYLTSFCQNECLYCGYRQSNPIAERIQPPSAQSAPELGSPHLVFYFDGSDRARLQTEPPRLRQPSLFQKSGRFSARLRNSGRGFDAVLLVCKKMTKHG